MKTIDSHFLRISSIKDIFYRLNDILKWNLVQWSVEFYLRFFKRYRRCKVEDWIIHSFSRRHKNETEKVGYIITVILDRLLKQRDMLLWDTSCFNGSHKIMYLPESISRSIITFVITPIIKINCKLSYLPFLVICGGKYYGSSKTTCTKKRLTRLSTSW